MKLRLLITLFLALSLLHECEGFRYRHDTDDIVSISSFTKFFYFLAEEH